ncbi:IS630 transposase-related protein [Moorena producens]
MPVPYSYDLRKKVISAIDDGMVKTQAVRLFEKSIITINIWLKKIN